MNLIKKLRNDLNLTCLFIAHELPVIRYMCDRVAVIYKGEIVERAPTEELIQKPVHPYTQILISAVPIADPTRKRERVTEVRKRESVTKACKFYPRCRHAMKICEREKPESIELEDGHHVVCHLYN
jgi:oligopeptide/dipeptide ABC transporter ATP-binding protein